MGLEHVYAAGAGADGMWYENPEHGPPEAEIVVAGDWAPIRAFAPFIARDPLAVYGDLTPVLQRADLRIVNLEAALGGEHARVKSGSVFRGDAEHIRGLTAIPFDVATLANNHIFDFGTSGFRATRSLLEENGIAHVGAGLNAAEADAARVVEARGIRVGILNFSEGEDRTTAGPDAPGVRGWDGASLVASIRALRPSVDLLVVIAHAGIEYIPFPPPYVVEALDCAVTAGADLVIGHHPHVPQGIRIFRGVPICYSLGNFVFFQETDRYYRTLGYLIRALINRRGLCGIDVVPYRIGREGVRRLHGAEGADFEALLRAISRPLVSSEDIANAWHGFLRYYGVAGFRAEVAGILDRLAADPAKGAAMFRNRMIAPQHRRHWLALLDRVAAGQLEQAPEWAVEWNHAYATRRI